MYKRAGRQSYIYMLRAHVKGNCDVCVLRVRVLIQSVTKI